MIQKVENNGLTVTEVEYAVRNANRREFSRTSHQPVYIVRTPSGQLVCVPFEEVDAVVLAPVTAFVIRSK